jgi:selenide,water dikinase
VKRLVLLGGGHAHLAVLRRLAHARTTGWDVELVTPSGRMVYSGMLPGWIAGQHALDEGVIPLGPLAAAAGVRLRLGTAIGLDAGRRAITLASGERLAYDVLSLDIGSAPPDAQALPGAQLHACPVRPLDGFVDGWTRTMERLAGPREPFRVLVLGAGAGGVELALAVQQRMRREGWNHGSVAIAAPHAQPLHGAPARVVDHLATLLRQRGIGWHGGARALSIEPGLAVTSAGALPFDWCIVATGATPAPWLRDSGLALDADGFVRVQATLNSASHADVYAAGDVVALPEPRPRSGVYAVRAGPLLAENLLRAMAGRAPRPWRPQARALYLLNTADRRAVALWGGCSVRGHAVWRWKDWIDRRFVARRRQGWPDGPA